MIYETNQMLLFAFIVLIVLANSSRISPYQNARLKKICGKQSRESRYKSFGGRRVRRNEFPWIATLYFAHDEIQELKRECSGVLISQRHILTAAHCVTKIDEDHRRKQCSLPITNRRFKQYSQSRIWTIFIGSKCADPEKCHTGRRVAKITVNPYYDSCDNLGDLAIVELSRNVPVFAATPICMPTAGTKLQKVLNVAGAGLDPSVPVRAQLSRGLQVLSVPLTGVDNEFHLIRTKNSSAWTCSGDSGGPLFQLDKNRRYTLVGTVIFANGQCEKGDRAFTTTYTDVRKEVRWICEETGVCPIPWRTSPRYRRHTDERTWMRS